MVLTQTMQIKFRLVWLLLKINFIDQLGFVMVVEIH